MSELVELGGMQRERVPTGARVAVTNARSPRRRGGRLGAWLAGALLALTPWTTAELTAADHEDFILQLQGIQQDMNDLRERWEYVPFELEFTPLEVDRILIEQPDGTSEIYHYVVFRIRNRQATRADFVQEHYSAYNEVLQSLAEEYDRIEYVIDEQGARLVYDDPDQIAAGDAVIANRPAEARGGDHPLNITALVFDEQGTRMRLLDEVPGAGPQEAFNFEDRGETRYNMAYEVVKHRIEEAVGRRLRTMHELREVVLDPYDPSVRDEEGVAQGEVYGVLIFDRLPEEGDVFTVLVQGLSNKFRSSGMTLAEGAPEVTGRPQDYFNADIRRRLYRIEVARPGDEYFLDQDPMTIERAGWIWAPSFLRINQRKAMSYTKYYLDHIRLQQPRPHPSGDGRLLHDPEVREESVAFLAQTLAEVEGSYQADLADLRQEREAVATYYRGLSEDEAIEEDLREFFATRLERRMEELDERIGALETRMNEVVGSARAELEDIREDIRERQE